MTSAKGWGVGGGGWGVGQPWTCPWVDVHGVSMVGCHSVDTGAVDEYLSLLLWCPCCTLFFSIKLSASCCSFFLTAPCLEKNGLTIVPPTIMGLAKNAETCRKQWYCEGIQRRKRAVAVAAAAAAAALHSVWLVCLPLLCSLPSPPQHFPIVLLFLQPKTRVRWTSSSRSSDSNSDKGH